MRKRLIGKGEITVEFRGQSATLRLSFPITPRLFPRNSAATSRWCRINCQIVERSAFFVSLCPETSMALLVASPVEPF